VSDWREVVEDGRVFWVHDTIGNVMKLAEGSYIAMIPKVVKMGPFKTPEEAQGAAIKNRTELDHVLEEYNSELMKRQQ